MDEYNSDSQHHCTGVTHVDVWLTCRSPLRPTEGAVPPLQLQSIGAAFKQVN